EAGKSWAMNLADADELERLADLRDRHVTDWYVLFDQNDRDAYSVAERIAFIILGKDAEPGRAEAREFWDRAVGDVEVSSRPEGVGGLVDGALEAWGAVAAEQ